jgi:CO/xanthine dehydrogenase FAD-binding subunit
VDLVDVADFLPAPDTTWQPGDAFVAGGTWLFSEPQPGVRRLLDLQAFGWPALVERGDGLEIAATCTLAELAAWTSRAYPGAPALFRQCCDALLGSVKVWHGATVGGNVCLALPAGPMTSLTAALDGVCLLWSPDATVRAVPVAEFVWEPRRTALRPGELLRAIRLPAAALRARTAFRQVSLSTYGRSAAVVIGRVDADGTAVLTVTASTPRPVQLRFAGLPAMNVAVAAVHDAVPARGGWQADVHGDPRWRAAMTARLVREVCGELAGTA